jgi:hypothetical protein
MKERGIIMSGDNPKLILEGRKTQTRRVVRPPPHVDWQPLGVGLYHPSKVAKDGEVFPGKEVFGMWDEDGGWACPHGVASDRLWVRERFEIHRWWRRKKHLAEIHGSYCCQPGEFCTTLTPDESELFIEWKRKHGGFPSIFMFRSLSRIALEITKVRVERLQDISAQDCVDEGIDPYFGKKRSYSPTKTIRLCKEAYAALWDSLHGKGAWDKNPWVWVIEFKKV